MNKSLLKVSLLIFTGWLLICQKTLVSGKVVCLLDKYRRCLLVF